MSQVTADVKEDRDSRNAAEEVAQFLMRFATDVEAREKLAADKEAFIAQADLSEEAKKIIAQPSANVLLGKLAPETASLMVVIILETVTTDVFVV